MLKLSISVRFDAFVLVQWILTHGISGKLLVSVNDVKVREFCDKRGAKWAEIEIETNQPLNFVEGVYAMSAAVITDAFINGLEGEVPCYFGSIELDGVVVRQYHKFKHDDFGSLN